MFIKKSLSLILSIIICMSFTSCSYCDRSADQNAATDLNERPTPSYALASWNNEYDSKEDMISNADIIIEGTVVNSIPEMRGNTVFTMNYIRIDAITKGNLSIGTIIPLLQTGGTLGDTVTPAVNEIPLLTVGDKYELYLEQTDVHAVYGQYYLIAGGFQGVLHINADGTKEALSEENLIFNDNIPAVAGVIDSWTPLTGYHWEKDYLLVNIMPEEDVSDSRNGRDPHSYLRRLCGQLGASSASAERAYPGREKASPS